MTIASWRLHLTCTVASGPAMTCTSSDSLEVGLRTVIEQTINQSPFAEARKASVCAYVGVESRCQVNQDVRSCRDMSSHHGTIAFGGRDTLFLLFWNPKIWQDDMKSKVLPEKTIPVVREAARNVATYVWNSPNCH